MSRYDGGTEDEIEPGSVGRTAVAETHAELILFHPFREGNGRVSRLIADVMAVQAGYDPFAWDVEDEAGRNRYHAALRRGFVTNYAPMARLAREALRERSP